MYDRSNSTAITNTVTETRQLVYSMNKNKDFSEEGNVEQIKQRKVAAPTTEERRQYTTEHLVYYF